MHKFRLRDLATGEINPEGAYHKITFDSAGNIMLAVNIDNRYRAELCSSLLDVNGIEIFEKDSITLTSKVFGVELGIIDLRAGYFCILKAVDNSLLLPLNTDIINAYSVAVVNG